MDVNEVWKPVYKWESLYEVSNLGNVRSLSTLREVCYKGRIIYRKIEGKVLKTSIGKDGYRHISICERSRHFNSKIGRMVLMAFVSVQSSDMETCHNDGNRLNDCLSNLRWDTGKGNAQDKYLHGTHHIGADSVNSKLSVVDVIEIREMINEAVPHRLIAGKFGIGTITISKIRNGKSYFNIPIANLETVLA